MLFIKIKKFILLQKVKFKFFRQVSLLFFGIFFLWEVFMKKKLFVFFLAIFVGVILALPALKIYIPETNPQIVDLFVLQTGVFKNLENAIESQKNISNSIIYQDQNQYRILVGASLSEENLQKIEQVLLEDNIHYYKKKLSVQVDSELFYKYNLMLEKTKDKETIVLLNKKMLEKMMEL